MVDGMNQRDIIEEVEGERMEAVKKQVPEMVKEETTPRKGKRVREWWKTYYVYAVSSLIILITVVVVLAVKHFWPFGNGTLLNGDFIMQGWPFIMEFKRKLATGDSLLYTWHAGFGTNFYSILSYGMFNPFTLIYMLVPESYILQTSTVLFVINLLAMNGTMLYFLTHRPMHALPQNKIANMLFSLSYTLCMYMVSNINNWTHLIVAAIFPLIILGLEQFVANKGWKLYFVTLMLSFLFNYYLTGLFCFFIILYYLTLEFDGFRVFVKKSGKIFLISVLAIAVSAVLMLPTALQMSGQSYTKSVLLDQTWFTTFFDIVKNFLALNRAVDRGTASDSYGEVNLYYGLLMLMLTSLYFLNGKIKLSVRLKKLALVVLYVVAFNCNGLNYVFHMMHYPTWFPNRFALFFTLLCIILAYEGWVALEETHFQSLTLVKGVLVGLGWVILSVLCFAFAETVEYQFTYYFSIMIFLFYMVALLVVSLLKGKGKQILVVLGCVELALNFDYAFIYRSASQTVEAFDYYYGKEKTLIQEYTQTEVNGFSRLMTAVDVVGGTNGGMLLNQKSNTIFASSMSDVSDYLYYMGILGGGNTIKSYVYTPATSSLMNIQYILYDGNSQEKRVPEELYSTTENIFKYYQELAENENVYVYENPTCLSVGYMIDDAYSDVIGKNGEYLSIYYADNINKWVEGVSGVTGVLEPVDLPVDNIETKNCEGAVVDNQYYMTQDLQQRDVNQFYKDGLRVFVQDNKSEKYTEDEESVLRLDCVAEEAGDYYIEIGERFAAVGYLEKGERYYIYYNGNEDVLKQNLGLNGQIQLYRFNEEQWEKAYDKLSQQQLVVDSYTSHGLEGTIDVQREGTFFTSIPYDDNWKLYVDEEQVEVDPLFFNGFVSTHLTEGTHTIRLEYQQNGIVEGTIISILAVLLFVGIVIHEHRKKESVFMEKEIVLKDTFYSEEYLLERQERQKKKKEQENPEDE